MSDSNISHASDGEPLEQTASTDSRATDHRTDERERDPDASCPECSARLEADHERGERVCSECGLVVEEDEIDRGPEWRAFDSAEQDQKSRVGAPATKMIHDDGLSTNIDWRDRDAYGNSLSSRKRQQMERLRTWNERFRARNSQDRNLKHALGEIDRMASALGLPQNVREMASVIYRRALDEDLLPGRSIEGVATASLYAAARQANVPRSLDEADAVSRVEREEVARTYRYVARELGLEVQPAAPEHYVPRFVSDLEMSDELERQARAMIDTARSSGMLSGKSPVCISAAAVYAASLVCGEEVTQEDVGDVADVSMVTIRTRYQELLEASGLEEQVFRQD